MHITIIYGNNYLVGYKTIFKINNQWNAQAKSTQFIFLPTTGTAL